MSHSTDVWAARTLGASFGAGRTPICDRPRLPADGAKRLARAANLPLVGAVPHTVVTMVNGGRITDGGEYPKSISTPSTDS
jgi:hypothetical protein